MGDTRAAVTFCSSRYLARHRRGPKGQGTWRFYPYSKREDCDHSYWLYTHTGTYPAARKAAHAHYQARGIVGVVWVLP